VKLQQKIERAQRMLHLSQELDDDDVHNEMTQSTSNVFEMVKHLGCPKKEQEAIETVDRGKWK
jgi:hypothetical protein